MLLGTMKLRRMHVKVLKTQAWSNSHVLCLESQVAGITDAKDEELSVSMVTICGRIWQLFFTW